MKLFLQTSSGQPSLILWDNRVLFEAQYDQMQRLDYGDELAKALAKTDRQMSELDGIIVDTGPGRLGSTRTAVAFANGLGFALDIALTPLSSFVSLGVYAESIHARPCLVLRKAARRQYHWALVSGGKIIETGFSLDAQITPASYSGPAVVVGDAAEGIVALPTLKDVIWANLNIARGEALSLLSEHLIEISGQAVPLVETEARTYEHI